MMKLFLFRKRYLAIPGAILAVCALCLVTTLPSYVTTAATQRQLPIYCVQRDQKVVSLSFDAAWGDGRVRQFSTDRFGRACWKFENQMQKFN